jgi:hypothetical protein
MGICISLNVRTMMRASGALVLWLLCASLADAAPVQRGAAGPLCDPQTPAHRKLPRHPKSFGGPLRVRPESRGVVTDMTARLQRGRRANLLGDDDAIQNDAPAAQLDIDERATPALRWLGVLLGSADGCPDTRSFSPRSPRGPPVTA